MNSANEDVTGERRAIAGGLDVVRPNAGQAVALMRVLHAELERARRLGSVAPLMEFLYAHLALTLSRIGSNGLACGRGCSYCCTSWVTASAPEVLYAMTTVPHVRQATILETAAGTRSRTQAERLRMVTPCPLLEDGRCTVYPARPLVCRTAVSRDAHACQRVYETFSGETIPADIAYGGVKGVYGLALAGAIKRAGLKPFFYEYNAALAAALVPEAETAWLSGRDIFNGVQHDPQGEMFASDWNVQLYRAAFA
jgi:hypothetical protein